MSRSVIYILNTQQNNEVQILMSRLPLHMLSRDILWNVENGGKVLLSLFFLFLFSEFRLETHNKCDKNVYICFVVRLMTESYFNLISTGINMAA